MTKTINVLHVLSEKNDANDRDSKSKTFSIDENSCDCKTKLFSMKLDPCINCMESKMSSQLNKDFDTQTFFRLPEHFFSIHEHL